MTSRARLPHISFDSSEDCHTWLPWKGFRSTAMKARMNGFRREVNGGSGGAGKKKGGKLREIPLMNAFLVDSLAKLKQKRTANGRESAVKPVKIVFCKKVTARPLTHRRWKSSIPYDHRIDPQPSASGLRPAFTYMRTKSAISRSNTGSVIRGKSYGRLDGLDGELPGAAAEPRRRREKLVSPITHIA